jgi:hypothetical protein
MLTSDAASNRMACATAALSASARARTALVAEAAA